jgi:glyoxylase-like metal-dependent hydrolase (beta-lactamase superfamily II)
MDHLYLIGNSEISDPKDCAVFLLDFGEQLVLIDAGAGRSVDKLIAHVKQFGLEPDRISTLILTHCHIDHVGGAAEFQERFNTRLMMHALDAEIVERGDRTMTGASWYGVKFKPLNIDLKLQNPEDRLTFDQHELVCLHTPGHSPGSISAYIDLDGKRVLFGQDIHGPFIKEFGANIQDWEKSMQTLLSLKADILCEGHFGIYQPNSAVTAYIERYLDEFGAG